MGGIDMGGRETGRVRQRDTPVVDDHNLVHVTTQFAKILWRSSSNLVAAVAT